jgi:shikimate kinase
MPENITLIGMAGVGKSMGGIVLAQKLGWNFVDIDERLVAKHGMPLQALLDSLGEDDFIHAESQEVLSLDGVIHTVVAPGGSIIYAPEAMAFLKQISKLVYLHDEPEVIEARIDARQRGIVGLKNRSFRELFTERHKLYQAAADYTVDVNGKNPEVIAEEIKACY